MRYERIDGRGLWLHEPVTGRLPACRATCPEPNVTANMNFSTSKLGQVILEARGLVSPLGIGLRGVASQGVLRPLWRRYSCRPPQTTSGNFTHSKMNTLKRRGINKNFIMRPRQWHVLNQRGIKLNSQVVRFVFLKIINSQRGFNQTENFS